MTAPELSDEQCARISAEVFLRFPQLRVVAEHNALDDALIRAGYHAAPPAVGRDQDWILAMAASLGTNSGLHVPIVPTKEAFDKLFAAVRESPGRQTGETGKAGSDGAQSIAPSDVIARRNADGCTLKEARDKLIRERAAPLTRVDAVVPSPIQAEPSPEAKINAK